MKQYVSLLTICLCLTACEVGPDYKKPDVKLPAKWLSSSQKFDEKAQIDQTWWKNFDDSTLEKLIATADSGNFDLKIAVARIAQARANRAQAGAGLLPTINARGSDLRQANRISFPGAGGGPFDLTKPFSTYEVGFDATWELDLFGGAKRQIEEASANLEAAEANAGAARVSLMAEVAKNYFDIRHYQAQISIADDTIASSQKTIDLTQEQFKAGIAPHIDVTRADSALEEARSEKSAAQNLLAQAEFSLDILLGAQPGTAHGMIDGAPVIPVVEVETVMATPAQVIANRPDIRAAERDLAAATAQQGVATAAMLPDVSLSGFFGLLNNGAGDLLKTQSKSWSGGASILQPVLDFGRLKAGLNLANAQSQEALAIYEKSVVTALSDVESALTAYAREEERRQSLSKIVEDDRKALSVARERYQHGDTNFLDTLYAQRSLYKAQTDLAGADAQVSKNLVALYKSLGGGWKR